VSGRAAALLKRRVQKGSKKAEASDAGGDGVEDGPCFCHDTGRVKWSEQMWSSEVCVSGRGCEQGSEKSTSEEW
jgi:hypothetical protein